LHRAELHLLLPFTTMSSPSEVEHILSPVPQDNLMAISPPPVIPGSTDRAAREGGVKLKRSPPGKVELSVFDILNIFRRRWFLSRTDLLTHVISAQKAEDGNISWVEFTPQYHSHLVKCAIALVPHPVLTVKKVMFVFVLELLNGKGNIAFFDLQLGGRKANNAQKEKRRLARKRSRASKREREREAAKAAKLPTRERQCVACGRKFNSRKTAKKHKCPKSKVVRVPREAAGGQASQATPTAELDKPPAPPTSHAPTTPPYRIPLPAVTGDSQEPSQAGAVLRHIHTGKLKTAISSWHAKRLMETGLFRPA
jgi:5-methylcytosine-specific restriction endonuclease McrA